MPNGRGIKRIPLSRATDLPRLKAPAGYVVIIEDVELSDRFKIIHLQEVSRRSLARVTDLAFETELFLLLSAAHAERLALELHDRFAAGGDINDWFDLDRAQVAQLRDLGRPQAQSLRDLALSEAEGQSLVEKSRIVSVAPEAPPRQTRAARQPSQRRWATWLLLVAIVTLGASVLGNAPQLRRLFSGLSSPREMPAQRKVVASATADPSPEKRATTSTSSSAAVDGAGDVFYVLARANARVCASRECGAALILEAGTRLVAEWYESGQSIDGETTWIVFRYRGANLYTHRSVLSRNRLEVNAAERPSAILSPTPVASATPAPTDPPEPTATVTLEPTSTIEPSATAAPTETHLPTATLTSTATAADVATVLYIDTVNNLNARVRACPSTDCEIVSRLGPGDQVMPTGRVDGETVNGSRIWIEFELQGQTAYIHSSLVTANP